LGGRQQQIHRRSRNWCSRNRADQPIDDNGEIGGWSVTVGEILQSYGDNNVNSNVGDEGTMPAIAKK
jgi:hypothetical protein